MADCASAPKKIEDYLKRCPGRSATISDIANGTGVPVQLLRKLLRQLKQKKVVFQDKQTPTKWTLCDQRSHPRTKGAESSSSFNDVSRKVIQYLSQQQEAKTAIDIARHIGLSTKKEANQVLYRLRDQQLLQLDTTQGRKPVWSLCGKAADMATELFRDTSKDTGAPGAYSPEKRDDRGPCMHSQRQQHQQMLWEHPRSCTSGRGHHFKTLLESRQNVPRRSNLSSPQKPMKKSDSGIITDDGNNDDASCSGEGMMMTVASDAGGDHRTVTMVNFNQNAIAQTGALPTMAAESEKNDNGDDSFDLDDDCDDFEEESGYEPQNMASRFQDMMGFPVFTDMTYAEDEEMPEDENMTMTLDDIVLVRISLEPNHTISVLKLAEDLGKTEEEIHSLLETVAEEVKVSGGQCGLTDVGKALVKDKLEACPSLAHQWSPHHHHGGDGVFNTQEVPQTAPHTGHPPFPKELIATDPVFGHWSPGLSSTETSVPKAPGSRGQGRGRGRVVSGAHYVRDLESQSVCLPPSPFPSASPYSSPSKASATSTMTAPSTPIQEGRQTENVSSVLDLPRKPFTATKSMPPASMAGNLSSSSLPHGVTTAPGQQAQREQGVCVPVQFEPSIHPELQKFTQEGLTVIPGLRDRMPMILPPGGQGSSSGISCPSFQNPATSIELIEHQLGNTGLTVQSVGQVQSSGFQLLGPASMGIPPPSISQQMQPSGTAFMGILPPSFSQQMQPSGPASMGISPPSFSQQMQPSGPASMGISPPSFSQQMQPSGPASMGISPPSFSQQMQPSGPASVPVGESSNSTLQITSESFAALNKNPISALMEYAQSRRMQAIIEVVNQKGPSHRPVFVMAARVGNRQFAGVTCHNKKDGRKEAADVALRTLIAEGQYSAASPTPSINVAPENMTHFDKIAALTHQTFNTLIATIPENLAGRKVIAGMVMKRGEDDVGIVISIGTGNRCITGDKLSLEGNTVNDSHAEIITRRGFMRYLYQQLERYEDGKPHDLFERGASGKLRVKSNITFHLYISTAPCGDGALFSPRDVESNSGVVTDVERKEHCPTFTSNVQGLLRTKMEGGEGTIPVDTKEITMQTWDGVVRGERLRTMSCTDKICRWNVLGLQGALLSHFLEPIYLDSLTLGFLYDHGHLSRAVCCRLAREPPLQDGMLPPGFQLKHPWLGRVTACQPLRETQKTKAFSINWTHGDQKAEVLDGTLGHCYTAVEKRLFSRLAKRSLYDSFKQVAQHLGRSDLLQAPSYHHSKMAAQDFQTAKAAMIKKFQQMGCGWVKKPVEEEMFS